MRPVYICLLFGLAVANVSIYRIILSPPLLEIQVFREEEHAILVRDPRGNALLIDAGPDAGILRELGRALPMWQRNIDAMILTSSEHASIGGLPEVMNRYDVADPIRFGATTLPYGATVRFGSDIRILVTAPHRSVISYGASDLAISSTTPTGVYRLDSTELWK